MITLIIIAVTCIVSYMAFQDPTLFHKLSFNAYDVAHRKQYYRLFTNGFVHAGWEHLLLNMFVLYSFGQTQEMVFSYYRGWIFFPLLYLLALPASCIGALLKYKDNPGYTAVGASGAVNAIVFSYILISPLSKLYLFFALPISAYLFAILYLLYSSYMAKRNSDHIGHEAHISGAFFGLIFTIATIPNVVQNFIAQFTN